MFRAGSGLLDTAFAAVDRAAAGGAPLAPRDLVDGAQPPPDEDLWEDTTNLDADDLEQIFAAAMCQARDATGPPSGAGISVLEGAASRCIEAAKRSAAERARPVGIASLLAQALGEAAASKRRLDGASKNDAFPVVGCHSRCPADNDATVATLKQERQLWRLLQAVDAYLHDRTLALGTMASLPRPVVAGYNGPSLVRPGAALPADCVANDALLLSAVEGGSAELPLLVRVLLPWLERSAADEATVSRPDGHDAAVGSIGDELAKRVGSGDDDDDPLWYATRMWDCAAGAASAPGHALDPDAVFRGPEFDSPVDLLRAPPPSELGVEDAEADVALSRSVWTLLRCGQAAAAQALAVRCGQPWRAAALAGWDVWRDEQDGAAVADAAAASAHLAQLEGRAAAGGSDVSCGPAAISEAADAAATAAAAISMLRRGNPFSELQRSTAARALAMLADASATTVASGLQRTSDSNAAAASNAATHQWEWAALNLCVGTSASSDDSPASAAATALSLFAAHAPCAVVSWEDALFVAAFAAVARLRQDAVAAHRHSQLLSSSRLPRACTPTALPDQRLSDSPLDEGVLAAVLAAATRACLPSGVSDLRPSGSALAASTSAAAYQRVAAALLRVAAALQCRAVEDSDAQAPGAPTALGPRVAARAYCRLGEAIHGLLVELAGLAACLGGRALSEAVRANRHAEGSGPLTLSSPDALAQRGPGGGGGRGGPLSADLVPLLRFAACAVIQVGRLRRAECWLPCHPPSAFPANCSFGARRPAAAPSGAT